MVSHDPGSLENWRVTKEKAGPGRACITCGFWWNMPSAGIICQCKPPRLASSQRISKAIVHVRAELAAMADRVREAPKGEQNEYVRAVIEALREQIPGIDVDSLEWWAK